MAAPSSNLESNTTKGSISASSGSRLTSLLVAIFLCQKERVGRGDCHA